MLVPFSLLVAASSVAASPLIDSLPFSHRDVSSESISIVSRGIAPSTAPSGDYAPSINQSCPPTLIRQPSAQNKSTGIIYDGEQTWVAARRANAVSAWSSYLGNAALNLSGFDVTTFLSNTSNLPNVAIASSGGGYRAMLHAAGLFNAFDSRNESSVKQGTGGILQVATYMAGLSGGSWFTGSLAINDFPTIYELRNIWNLSTNLVEPGGVFDLLSYYSDLQSEITEKDKAGNFDLSLTDYWGAALSRHLVNATNSGAATLFSSIQNLTSFSQHQAPFPIIIADSRRHGEGLIPVNTTIYEFTPFEFGSWNPSLQAFIPMEYLGTQASNGKANGTNGCVRGYDNAGFVMGSSATLFNVEIFTLLNGNGTLTKLLGGIVDKILGKDNDIATYPNPFTGLSPTTFSDADQIELDLVDGGEDNENVPLWPLLHQERNVDVILALDASADTSMNWPNGSSLVQTRNRMANSGFGLLGNFPDVPADTNTFINRGLNSHTTFFGCNETTTPLVIYIPSNAYTNYVNFTTLQLAYTDQERDAFLDNGFHEAAGNLTALSSSPSSPLLPTCLACALVSRAEQRAGRAQTSQCQECFSAYCWDGVSNSTLPDKPYEPAIPGVGANKSPGGAGTSATPTPSTAKGGKGAAVSIRADGGMGLLLAGALSGVAALVGSSLVLL